SIDLISLREAGRTPSTDLAKANEIFKKCCVQFVKGQEHTVPNDISDGWLGGDTDLKAADGCGAVEPEEKALFDGAAQKYGLSSRMRAYYVKSITVNPAAYGYSLGPYCATGPAAPYVNNLVIEADALADTLAHELGHILINRGAHSGIDDPNDTNNLMVGGRTGSDIDDSQCQRIYKNA